MPIPHVITRLNRWALNPLMRTFAGRIPPLAIVIHHGRRSGRRYETPVLAFPRGASVTFALTYGTDVDWLKNVMAEDGCRLVYRSRERELSRPRMLPAGKGHQRLPAPIRSILRLINVDDFLEMDKVPRDTGQAVA
jgi:deazaflavin-dependent oxidoreductase (nitroreductase family)